MMDSEASNKTGSAAAAAVEASEPQHQLTIGKKRNSTSTPSEARSHFSEVGDGCNLGSRRKALILLVIQSGRPFKNFAGGEFKQLMKYLDPRFEVPSSMAVHRDVMAMYMLEKQKLKDFFKKNRQRVCLTIDTWKSIHNYKFMRISAHFIDDNWKLHKKIINFCHVESHEGLNDGKILEACLLEWGIDNLLTVTLEDASRNHTTIKYLKDRLINNNAIMNADFLHVRCAAHVLAHVVKAGLRKYHMSIRKIRAVLKYVFSRPSRFKECVAKEKIECTKGLVLDDKTRWNSTLTMLEAAEKFFEVFQRLEREDAKFFKKFCSSTSTSTVDKEAPTLDIEDASRSDSEYYEEASSSDYESDEEDSAPDQKASSSDSESDVETSYAEDWSYARNFVKFLKVFADATVKVTASTYLTSDSFLWQLCVIHKQLSIWVNSEDPILNTMAKTMFHKYNKYFGTYEDMNPFLFIAVLLDPREKEFGLKLRLDVLCENNEDLAVKLMSRVKSVLQKLYEEYKLLYPDAKNGAAETSNVHDTEMNDSEDNVGPLLRQRLDKLKEESVEYKSEVDSYLAEPCESTSNNSQFDLLGWWKTNSTKYGILSYIARDVLAIPISSVASKSKFFNSGRRVLDEFRSSLTPKTVEDLICMQSWICSTTDLDLSGLGDDEEEDADDDEEDADDDDDNAETDSLDDEE